MSGLLVVGDVVTDVVALHDRPLVPGTDTAARIRTLPGGAGANVACWAVRSGWADVRLLARVGTDRAEWHEAELRRAGVRPALVRDPEAPTGTVVSLVDGSAGAERTFLTDSGAVLRLSAADWSADRLDGVVHLHLSGYLFFAAPSRGAALAALTSALERGLPVSVDPASAGFLAELGAGRFLDAVAGAAVLLPNADEAALLTGAATPEAAAVALSRTFPLVVVTLGAEGALLAAGGEVLARVPAPRVDPVDTTGAGDAFTGTFLAAYLSGARPAEAAAFACRAAAEACTRPGARPG
ncbi:sugar kinase [Streptomyces sp. MUM 203J]|uniref:carbohydrate kinase family protein n=1 Tax=Streptomyces sp. MUM 203J TaxID=2791990 RepID=UPI0023D942F5|nr:PfkB family carbohydrate kinase [Streptomyces sp. MUM 203J]MCH0543109.1 sugar kinase [Streptomyces sp. MUM 203J]